jgi:hypothetical protein
VTVGDSDIGPIDPDAVRRTLEPEKVDSFRYESLRIVTRMTTLILHLDVEEDKTDGNSGFR